MTSSQIRPTSTPSSPPVSSRSFLSRLKSPLSSKSRNYTDFYIQPDDPHRQYAPGDLISGTVIIKIVKPLRVTHLVVCLHGYAQVFKNPNTPGDAYKNYCSTTGSARVRKAGSYFGNGFVSLFEDEVVLCGEGRLAEGVYHFNFELEFPSTGLPSSIDFERGTISYMLNATLTRPTTMSPTASCDTKVYLTDTVDIAPIPALKPRVISLEPISRRARAKPRKRGPDDALQKPAGSEPPPTGSTLGPGSTIDDNEGPRSPSPSDVSYESQRSSGNASGTEYGVRSIHTTIDGSASQIASQTMLKGKTITATIDVLKPAFLRGDQIPIKVTVNHTKHVRSLKGIIITLYRQARVDMHPALPVVPNSKGAKTKSEDYYPKSRTGLGGLSLSSAGSCHLFRKDLCQSFAPLFVDPRTLTAEVKCAVRVPDEAFPTIANVPGAMISFKYYVEVVIDIQGKLTGLDRMVANAGLVNLPSAGGNAPMTGEDATGGMFSTWAGNFVDTDQIRREKGIVSALFEVVIGTKDSERNGKRKQPQEHPAHHNGLNEYPHEQMDPYGEHAYDPYYYNQDENGQYYDYGYDSTFWDVPGYEQHSTGGATSFPVPNMAEEEQGISEKERLRRAEERLLPSQPPDVAGPSTTSGAVQHGMPASAPVLPEDDDANIPYVAASSSSNPAHLPPPFPTATSPSSSRTPTAPPLQRHATGPDNDEATTPRNGSSRTVHADRQGTPVNGNATGHVKPLPPLPPADVTEARGAAPQYAASSSYVAPTDDKQELQRRRLEMERSAPPPPEQDEEGASSYAPSAPPLHRIHSSHLAPSAPVLDDEEEDLVDAVRRGRGPAEASKRQSEALPEYQR
ncbi:pH-response regulator protein palF/RIM8 [Pyrenophora tritici-repentis]|nr:pH-response regulator protein palF/RIM8 [Pyrenophora tritici-repentis]KAI0615410.1 pH-response regulator protein palF/RIM8 [Pyrenophora tritici-repentis]KAI0627467.1 pH-response regulator protein palF/RIM8 [Pyrenophora tritici-repentis]